MNYRRTLVAFLSAGFGLLAFAPLALAHVEVTPEQVAPAAQQVFTVSVPTEKEGQTTGLRLLIPEGFSDIMPTVKPGWSVEVKKRGDTPSEIDWTGGTIPADQRDEFSFSAQAPAKAGTATWKAYQTYGDGSVVSWDQKPDATRKGDENLTPYSSTEITEAAAGKGGTGTPLWLGLTSLVAALAAVVLNLRKP